MAADRMAVPISVFMVIRAFGYIRGFWLVVNLVNKGGKRYAVLLAHGQKLSQQSIRQFYGTQVEAGDGAGG